MKVRLATFLVFFVTLSVAAVAIACWDCPDQPECSDTHGCGCKTSICEPSTQRQAYGPLQLAIWGEDFLNETYTGSHLCYQWRTCVEADPWYGYYCNATGGSGACVAGDPSEVCIECTASGEWHSIYKPDYDCYD